MERHGSGVLCLALLLCCFTRVKQEGTNNTCQIVSGNEAPRNSLTVMLEVVDPIGSSGNELVANLTTFVEACVSDNGSSCCEPTSTNLSNATLHTLCQLFNGSRLVLYLYDRQLTANQLILYIGRFISCSHLGALVNMSIARPSPCCVLAPAVSSSGPPLCPSCTSSYSVTQDSSVSSISAHPITINTLQAIEDSSKSPTSAHPPTSSTYMLQVTQDSSVTSIGAHPSTSTPQVTQDSSVSSIGAHPSTSTPQATQGGSVSVTSEYPSTIYATQDSSVISIGAHPSTSSAFVQQIIRDTIRASSVKMQYSTTLVINNDDRSSSTPWPSQILLVGNSSNDTSSLTINQVISLGAGMGAFSILLILLGIMVIIFCDNMTAVALQDSN